MDDPARRSSAFALETSADEIALILGPLLASFVALAFDPAAAVVAAVALMRAGGFGLAVQRGTAPDPSPPREPGHPLRVKGMAGVAATMLFVGGLFGSYQVSTVAFGAHTDPVWTGALLAAFSVGSLFSGLFLAARKRESPLHVSCAWHWSGSR